MNDQASRGNLSVTVSPPSAGIVFDVKRFAIHDGPGVRTTVFLKGCPLRCAWCHNPESQAFEPELLFWEERCTGCGACAASCPRQAIVVSRGKASTDRSRCTACGQCLPICPAHARSIVGSLRSVGAVLAEIERDTLFYDQSGGGVTLSGGEPLGQRGFSVELLRLCRERRIHTAVDTCGYADPEDLASVAEHTDLFLYDIKLLDDRRHVSLTGVSNRRILDNLNRLSTWGNRVWVRVPLIPGINDAASDLEALGHFVARFPHVESIQILPYHRAGERKLLHLERVVVPSEHPAMPPDDASRAADVVRSIVKIPVTIGG